MYAGEHPALPGSANFIYRVYRLPDNCQKEDMAGDTSGHRSDSLLHNCVRRPVLGPDPLTNADPSFDLPVQPACHFFLAT